jgi:hypothetical protein
MSSKHIVVRFMVAESHSGWSNRYADHPRELARTICGRDVRRAALGAEPSRVARLVVGSGLRLVIACVAIGAAGAVAATGALSGMLFGVSAGDPPTFVGVILVVRGDSAARVLLAGAARVAD